MPSQLTYTRRPSDTDDGDEPRRLLNCADQLLLTSACWNCLASLSSIIWICQTGLSSFGNSNGPVGAAIGSSATGAVVGPVVGAVVGAVVGLGAVTDLRISSSRSVATTSR